MSVALLVIDVLLTVFIVYQLLKLVKLLLEHRGELPLWLALIGWVTIAVGVGTTFLTVFLIITEVF